MAHDISKVSDLVGKEHVGDIKLTEQASTCAALTPHPSTAPLNPQPATRNPQPQR